MIRDTVVIVRTPVSVVITDDMAAALAEAKGTPGPSTIERLWPQDLEPGADLDCLAEMVG